MSKRFMYILINLLLGFVLAGGSIHALAGSQVELGERPAIGPQQSSAPAQPMTDRTARRGQATQAVLGAASLSRGTPASPAGGGIISIPLSTIAPKIDGSCDEYAEAVSFPWADGGTNANGTIYLMHHGSYLYVCMQGIQGSFAERFGSLYLDPLGDGMSYTYAQNDDYAMRVHISNSALSSFHGTGVANGYETDSAIPALWTGHAFSSAASGLESVEWEVEYGRFGIKPCETIFRLAAYHHWLSGIGNDYGWPSNQYFDQPRTWQPAILQSAFCGTLRGNIAYVYRGNMADATSFFTFLTGNGYTVTMIPLTDVLTTNFAVFDLILIADDTGSLDQWGIAPSANQVNKIRTGSRPIIGLGEGGYAFFGQLGLYIGWPQGWHGPQDTWGKAASAPSSIYSSPYVVPDPATVYTPAANSVGIYLGLTPLPSDLIPVSLETPWKDHASLIFQGCRMLWGGSGNPTQMTTDGKNLFINTVEYMKTYQCAPDPPIDPACLTLTKTAVPFSGTTVALGSGIAYTITYSYSPNCPTLSAGIKLVDTVPPGTLFLPAGTSDGIVPAADGSLTWSVTPSAVPASKSFRVVVQDAACRLSQRTISNRAGLLIPGHPAFTSNVVTHSVSCGPVGFPNDQPPYAEREVQIHPYPLSPGQPARIEVTLTNSSAAAQPVTVDFMASPDKFGIGLTFNVFDSRSVTIPALSTAIAIGHFTPITPGQFCIQIRVSGTGFTPIYTQHNLDVTEELVAGQQNNLTVRVGNPNASPANINLVIVNTCPGWSATTIPATLTGMASGEVRDVVLRVTPPNPVTLGSGCHIDLQGWIGDQLIGGIRKLDVPPVHLPPNIHPPWQEREITLAPDPPVAGVPGQVCVFLQNPTSTAKNVQVQFAVADFGAGIGFTDIGTLPLTLPAFSASTYCMPWTPVATGTLHRCILVTLKQAGYQDMRSQRNVDIVRFRGTDLSQVHVNFTIGNPDLVRHMLTFDPLPVGIDPYWMPHITPDPPADGLGPGQLLPFVLTFAPAGSMMGSNKPAAPPQNPYFGDESKVQVGVFLDGQAASGFTVELSLQTTLYLPIIRK